MRSSAAPPFLDALSFAELEGLRARAIPKTYEDGTTIFREGDRSDQVLIVTSGKVRVACLRGGREVVLAERGAGEVLGELSAIDGQPRSADAIAAGPVRALCLTTEDFHAYLGEHPEATLRLLTTLAARLRQSDRRALEFGES